MVSFSMVKLTSSTASGVAIALGQSVHLDDVRHDEVPSAVGGREHVAVARSRMSGVSSSASRPSLRASIRSGSMKRVGERLSAFGEEAIAGAGGDEHPDAAALVEDALVDQHADALGGRRGIDPVEGGELVRRRGLGLFGQRAVDDRVLDAARRSAGRAPCPLRSSLASDPPWLLTQPTNHRTSSLSRHDARPRPSAENVFRGERVPLRSDVQARRVRAADAGGHRMPSYGEVGGFVPRLGTGQGLAGPAPPGRGGDAHGFGGGAGAVRGGEGGLAPDAGHAGRRVRGGDAVVAAGTGSQSRSAPSRRWSARAPPCSRAPRPLRPRGRSARRAPVAHGDTRAVVRPGSPPGRRRR